MRKIQDNTLKVQEIGFESKRMSINEDNFDKLFDLLQSPYSDPISSIVRETATNAWDSHKEAGVEEPIIILFDYNVTEGYSITFRDDGIGMSVERINNVYTQYLNSTKTETNDQAGYFGIGSKAPLSYVDEYFLTTIYNGIMYEYMIRKDDSGYPNLVILNDGVGTNDHNGTRIKIYINNTDDFNAFTKGIREQLKYFSHLLVIDNTGIINTESLNNFKLYDLDDFVIRKNQEKDDITNLTCNELDLLIGEVRYPIDWKAIDMPKIQWQGDFSMGIKFEIGELNVTLTRENVKYNKESKAFIKNRITEAVKKLRHKFDTEFYENITDNLEDFYHDIVTYTNNEYKLNKKEYVLIYKKLVLKFEKTDFTTDLFKPVKHESQKINYKNEIVYDNKHCLYDQLGTDIFDLIIENNELVYLFNVNRNDGINNYSISKFDFNETNRMRLVIEELNNNMSYITLQFQLFQEIESDLFKTKDKLNTDENTIYDKVNKILHKKHTKYNIILIDDLESHKEIIIKNHLIEKLQHSNSQKYLVLSKNNFNTILEKILVKNLNENIYKKIRHWLVLDNYYIKIETYCKAFMSSLKQSGKIDFRYNLNLITFKKDEYIDGVAPGGRLSYLFRGYDSELDKYNESFFKNVLNTQYSTNSKLKISIQKLLSWSKETKIMILFYTKNDEYYIQKFTNKIKELPTFRLIRVDQKNLKIASKHFYTFDDFTGKNEKLIPQLKKFYMTILITFYSKKLFKESLINSYVKELSKYFKNCDSSLFYKYWVPINLENYISDKIIENALSIIKKDYPRWYNELIEILNNFKVAENVYLNLDGKSFDITSSNLFQIIYETKMYHLLKPKYRYIAYLKGKNLKDSRISKFNEINLNVKIDEQELWNKLKQTDEE